MENIEIKSICPVQIPGRKWDVRVRLQSGAERLVCGDAPYTLAQAQACVQSCRRDQANHGAEVVWHGCTIVAKGGTQFRVSLVAVLGDMEYGNINADGQYVQEKDEIIEAARAEFGIPDDIPARVIY